MKHWLANLTPVGAHKKAHKRELPAGGYTENAGHSGPVEHLSNDDLQSLNAILPWSCFTADAQGRRFGNMAWSGKRDTPQLIPDPRIVHLDALFGLSDKSVLEVGCFEGIHTIALAQRAAQVHAIDSRIENVVKTVVRANLFGHQPIVSVCNLEDTSHVARLPVVDVLHHVGVFYHLKDPVQHLHGLGSYVRQGILLDTHYATPEMANESVVIAGKRYACKIYGESGVKEVFSGMHDHAKWLLLDDIRQILADIGFSDIRIQRDEVQRNGPRVTLYAAIPGAMRADP